MSRYLLSRLAHAVVVLLVVATVTFGLLQAAPGGPAVLMNPDLAPADAAIIRHNLGLDQPVYVQYVRWLLGLFHLDLGTSISYSEPVTELIVQRLPATLLLSGCALLLAVGVGIPLGAASARRPASWLDHGATLVSLLGLSVPNFWLAIMLILLFAVTLRVLPSTAMLTPGREPTLQDLLAHLVMPTLVLGLASLAQIVRFTRSSLLNVLREDYIRTARAKGVSEGRLLFDHALRNALVPVVTVVGVMVPRLVGGAVVTETIFAWPGMGRLATDAAFHRDYPVVMGVTLLVSGVVVVGNLVVDLAYGWLDPRIRLG